MRTFAPSHLRTLAPSHPRTFAPLDDEKGIALVVSLMAMTLMMALGLALMMTTMTEGKIAANYREGTEALYAADAAIERVMQDVLTVPDWNTIVSGSSAGASSFTDGPPGVRTLPDKTSMNLSHATNMLNCARTEPVCGDAEMNAITEERPWGVNNPRWRLYAHAPMHEVLPTETINSTMYVVVWAADDPAESDNNPLKDGDPKVGCAPADAGCVNQGRGVISLLAQAFGPSGVQRTVEVTLARTDTTEIERGYTGQRGQDEQNRRARKAPVQTPGKVLTRSTMGVATGGVTTP